MYNNIDTRFDCNQRELLILRQENGELRSSLKINSNMLAKQCDLARQVETENATLRKNLAQYEKDLIRQRAEIETLKFLVDGVMEVVEYTEAKSPAEIEWKKNWLARAREALK